MKEKTRLLFLVFFAFAVQASAQTSDTLRSWEFSAENNFYFYPNDFIDLPVFTADHGKLHLEARYNYENTKTFSTWLGYNFEGGKKIEYVITPMLGGIAGETNGIAPGLEITLSLKKFEFYSESEYVFDLESNENNFFYNWTDLKFIAKDWLWFGLTGQRMRTSESGLDYQRGLMIGFGKSRWEVNGYFYNFDTEEPFYIVGVSVSF